MKNWISTLYAVFMIVIGLVMISSYFYLYLDANSNVNRNWESITMVCTFGAGAILGGIIILSSIKYKEL